MKYGKTVALKKNGVYFAADSGHNKRCGGCMIEVSDGRRGEGRGGRGAGIYGFNNEAVIHHCLSNVYWSWRLIIACNGSAECNIMRV